MVINFLNFPLKREKHRWPLYSYVNDIRLFLWVGTTDGWPCESIYNDLEKQSMVSTQWPRKRPMEFRRDI